MSMQGFEGMEEITCSDSLPVHSGIRGIGQQLQASYEEEISAPPVSSRSISNDNEHEFFRKLEGIRSQLWQKEAGSAELIDVMAFGALGPISGFIGGKIMNVLNTTEIVNQQTFLDNRHKKQRGGRGLITVMNHIHWLDDPLIQIALYGKEYLKLLKGLYGDPEEFSDWKWTYADGPNFFEHSNRYLNVLFRDFFGRTKTVPVYRGAGLDQKSFTCSVKKLGHGDWFNIFLEGTRTRTKRVLNQPKPGFGQMIKQNPQTLIIPVAHAGMEKMSPFGCSPEVYVQQMFEEGQPLVLFDRKTKESGQVVLSSEAEMKEVLRRMQDKKEGIKVVKNKKHLLRTGKTNHIVVGDPFTLEKYAAKVPDNKKGWLMISEEGVDRLSPYYQQAIELGDKS